MDKKPIIIIAAVLIIAIGSYVANTQKSNGASNSNSATESHDDSEHEHGHNSDELEHAEVIDLTDQNEVSIDIANYTYSKLSIKIKKGTKVTWTNQDVVEHNVMREHEDSDAAHEAPTPDEVEPDVFAGPLLAKGESYSFTFNETGTITYHCAPHPYMVGQVIVVE